MKNKLIILLVVVLLAGGGALWYLQTGVKKTSTDTPTPDQTQDQNVYEKASEIKMVDKYLKENIVKLSPVEAVLGGTWYVISFSIDITTNTGTVVYEDGHIQEIRDFIYETNEQGEIEKLVIE